MPRNRISDQRKVACVQQYIQTESIVATQRWYRTTQGGTAPGETSIKRWHRKFLQNRTVADLPRSGRTRIRDEDFQRIEQEFHDNPRLSTRNSERALRIPRLTIRDVLKKKLKMFPYKISFLQQFLLNDYRQRLQWAQHCRREIRNDSRYLSRIVFSDECIFHTNGVVKKHNAHI